MTTHNETFNTRDKTSDRLRLQIVEMARRSGELVQQQKSRARMDSPIESYIQFNGQRDGSVGNKADYHSYRMLNRQQNRIDLDLLRAPGKEDVQIYPQHNVLKESSSFLLGKNDKSAGNIDRRGKTYVEIKNVSQKNPQWSNKQLRTDCKYSSFDSEMNIASGSRGIKAVKEYSPLTTSDALNYKLNYQKSEFVNSMNIKGSVSLHQHDDQNEKCEIKGNAILSPRCYKSSASLANKRNGIFASSFVVLKRRLKQPLNVYKQPLFGENHHNVEEYFVRAEGGDKKTRLQNKSKVILLSTSPRQTQTATTQKLDVKNYFGETSRPRTTTHNTTVSNIDRNTKLSPRNYSNDENYAPSSDISSSKHETYKCSYRLPEGGTSDTQPIVWTNDSALTEQPIPNVKTYVLEDDRVTQFKGEIAPLTIHNLRVHESIISMSNHPANRPNQGHQIPYNANRKSDGLQKRVDLESQENKRILTWLQDINTETKDFSRQDVISVEQLTTLQSCHGTHGSVITDMLKTVVCV